MSMLPRIISILFLSLGMLACGDDHAGNPAQPANDHVWKEQTDKIDEAKQLESTLLDAAEKNRQHMEQQSR